MVPFSDIWDKSLSVKGSTEGAVIIKIKVYRESAVKNVVITT
jgi:hypothetical protein